MTNIILFGVGGFAKKIYSMIEHCHPGVDIIGFSDNNSDNWGEWLGKKVYAPSELHGGVDKIIILSEFFYEEIKDSLVYWQKIPEDKIGNEYDLLKILVTAKYQNSADADIQNTLSYWKNHDISVFNQFVKNEEYSVVEWDNIENLPYVMLEDKRMYYPYNTKFELFEGRKIIRDVMLEQQPTSPHLYIKDDITINAGDVIADVGVGEGNFALRFVEKASKVYLIEGAKAWQKPLRKTFEKFKEKTVFIDKYAGRTDIGDYVRLDTVIDSHVDFFKMDVEGGEVEALLGARTLLTNSDAKCAVCSYHKAGDENFIKDMLCSYGYACNTSDGYMLFYHNYALDIFSTLDFRRGIVYGRKS